MAATNFTTLLTESWNFFVKRVSVIITSAVIVGIIIAIIQFAFASKMMPYAQKALDSAGINMARIQELQKRVQEGDQSALQDLQKEAEKAAENMPQNPQQAASFLPQFLRLGAWAIVISIVMGLISLAFNAFIFLVVLEDKSANDTVARAIPLYLPFLGVTIAMGVASLIWVPIPLLNFILAIIIGPRLLLSYVIFIKEKKGIIESVKQSWARSSGYWGKIVGNSLIMGIIICIVQMFAAAILGGFGKFLIPAIQMAITAFAVIFSVKLALTILENPIKKA